MANAVFTRKQQTAIVFLVSLVLLLQGFILFLPEPAPAPLTSEAKEWLSMQREFDSLRQLRQVEKRKHYRFNPNYLTDSRAYSLGLSVTEADRLFAHRKKGLYVNSPEEFRRVTGVSDSLLRILEPQMRFPEWVTKKVSRPSYFKPASKVLEVKDINEATADDLMAINGIGEGYSSRILEFREKLGGFVSMEQMSDVYGLPEPVISELHKRFKVRQLPAVKKIRINEATAAELAKFPYFRYAIAREIVKYRSMNGSIQSEKDLEKIKNFPTGSISIIYLYLEL